MLLCVNYLPKGLIESKQLIKPNLKFLGFNDIFFSTLGHFINLHFETNKYIKSSMKGVAYRGMNVMVRFHMTT